MKMTSKKVLKAMTTLYDVRWKKVLLLLAFALGLGAIAVQPVLALGPASSQLKPVLDELTIVLGDESLKGLEHKVERRKKIMAIITNGFDFRQMTKLVVRSTWNTISDEERDYLTGIMTKLLENAWIGKLEEYSGQEIVFLEEKLVKKGKAKVITELEYKGSRLEVRYALKKNGEAWMVYDIGLAGVSLIANYREQFKGVIRKGKYKGLVEVIEKKNKEFEKNDQQP